MDWLFIIKLIIFIVVVAILKYFQKSKFLKHNAQLIGLDNVKETIVMWFLIIGTIWGSCVLLFLMFQGFTKMDHSKESLYNRVPFGDLATVVGLVITFFTYQWLWRSHENTIQIKAYNQALQDMGNELRRSSDSKTPYSVQDKLYKNEDEPYPDTKN
jgi:heme/copper-type cytochrome/quinol oxidase subunit 2